MIRKTSCRCFAVNWLWPLRWQSTPSAWCWCCIPAQVSLPFLAFPTPWFLICLTTILLSFCSHVSQIVPDKSVDPSSINNISRFEYVWLHIDLRQQSKYSSLLYIGTIIDTKNSFFIVISIPFALLRHKILWKCFSCFLNSFLDLKSKLVELSIYNLIVFDQICFFD